MTVTCSYKYILQITSLLFVLVFSSCADIEISHEEKKDMQITTNIEHTLDTVIVRTAEELRKQIRSNRLIKLVDKEYLLKSTLHIDGVENLQIVGTALSKLKHLNSSASIVKLSNSNNIQLDGLLIGDHSSIVYSEPGVLNISHSSNIDVSNCTLFGVGTFALHTKDVQHLRFSNSEVTGCTALIFELDESQDIVFENVNFHDNNLSVSVLGAFTYGTKDVSFLNCYFLNNTALMEGNPAFNFFENLENTEKPVCFTNCVFKNNQGFKWYDEQIELKGCDIDATNFINFNK